MSAAAVMPSMRTPLTASCGPSNLHFLVMTNRQGQGPEHQGKKGRKDLVAQHDHGDDQAGTNQDVKQPCGQIEIDRRDQGTVGGDKN